MRARRTSSSEEIQGQGSMLAGSCFRGKAEGRSGRKRPHPPAAGVEDACAL